MLKNDRAQLGLAATAPEEFAFLVQLGFQLVRLTDTLARYETYRRFVQVFHGRRSYELGVQVGRWLVIKGVAGEQAFPLRDIVSLACAPHDIGFDGTTATSPELVGRFLGRLAAWTHDYALPLLTDGDDLFSELSRRNTAQYDAEQAMRLRAKADEAWSRKDLATVQQLYTTITAEMPTSPLRPSELGRLRYAQKHLPPPRPES